MAKSDRINETKAQLLAENARLLRQCGLALGERNRALDAAEDAAHAKRCNELTRLIMHKLYRAKVSGLAELVLEGRHAGVLQLPPTEQEYKALFDELQGLGVFKGLRDRAVTVGAESSLSIAE